VDDEPNILKIIEMILKDDEYVLHPFNSAPEAYDFIANFNGRIDLIISDIYMPEMNGLDFLKKIKSNLDFASVPFIFLTAADNETILEEGLTLGAIDFISKPINKIIFRNKIKSFLKSFTVASLQQNKVFETNSQEMSLGDILAFCEAEKINGFALIHKKDEYGVIEYENGLLANVILDDKESDEAFEILEKWDEFEVKIYRARFSPDMFGEFFGSAETQAVEDKSGKIPLPEGYSAEEIRFLMNLINDEVELLEEFVKDSCSSVLIELDDGKILSLLRKNGQLSLETDGE
jgi:CheY-like chemotaxis protein